MRETGPRFAFTALPFLMIVREAAAQVGGLTLIVLEEGANHLSFASVLVSREPEPVVTIDLDARAAILYSSGTAGVAKGVILTHRAMLWNLCQITQAVPMKRGDVMLAVLPMFRIFGFNATTLCRLATGAAVVTLPRFEPETFLAAIERYRVTHLALVPPIMQLLATHPFVESRDLSSLDVIVSGSAPLASALQRRVGDRLKCRVGQGFGMTESSGAISASHPDRIRLGASGQLLPATEARIVDPQTLIDNAPGLPGELWFRGPQAFAGYLNDPDATAATLTSDGWVRTGDIGYMDADGYVFITDRLKELSRSEMRLS